MKQPKEKKGKERTLRNDPIQACLRSHSRQIEKHKENERFAEYRARGPIDNGLFIFELFRDNGGPHPLKS